MTLDPVHVEGIAELAGRIARDVDDSDHRDLAAEIWDGYLDPLTDDGAVVVEPIDEVRRWRVGTEDIALCDAPFETCHGLDSGTVNPTTFKNGLVLDVAQAAMAGVPSDLDLHRARTIVATVHTNDPMVGIDDGWETYDEGYGRRQVVQAPDVNRFAEGVVHALSLYLAESEHAHEHAGAVDDLLILDGPIYPKGLLTWEDRHPELAELLAPNASPHEIVENYVRLVERFVEREVPLIGFVKNPSSKFITRTIRKKRRDAPWVDDAAFFTQVLEEGDLEDDRWRRETDRLTFTNWFVSRGGTDRTFADDLYGIERELPPERYEVTFFAVYDPRDDVVYKVEAPYAFTRDEEIRDRLRKQALRDVAAARGPPLAVAKADELARISAQGKETLRRRIEEEFGTERARTYDDVRWNPEEN